jgi:hypothetical protein
MPTYRPASYGIRLSEALAEAAAIAPVNRVILSCLEFRHPDHDPIRLVNDTNSVIVTHEATAALAPGQPVEYLASPIKVGIPEESPAAGSPQIIVTVAHLNGAIRAALEETRDSLQPWTVTERIYASDDLSGPARLPALTLEVLSVEFPGPPVAQITCGYSDPAMRAVPRITFRSSQYPGLSAR